MNGPSTPCVLAVLARMWQVICVFGFSLERWTCFWTFLGGNTWKVEPLKEDVYFCWDSSKKHGEHSTCDLVLELRFGTNTQDEYYYLGVFLGDDATGGCDFLELRSISAP